MEINIKIPRIIKSNSEGYSNLIGAIRPIFDMQKETTCILDFSDVKWLDANLLSIIGAAIEKRLCDCRIHYINNSISNTQADLWGRNGFGKYFNIVIPKRYDTTVDYKVFNGNQAKQFGKYVDDNLLSKHDLPVLSPALKRTISNNLQEIFGNAPMHGKCKNVVSCGQYYYTSKQLTFTIVDCGNTIMENVVDYFTYLQEATPTHGIQWAIVEDHSTKEIVNGKSGGKGLAFLKEFISLNDGVMQICSGNEFWEYKKGNEMCSYIYSDFPGTIVTITINMNDDKSYSLKNENLDDLF